MIAVSFCEVCVVSCASYDFFYPSLVGGLQVDDEGCEL
jgi:hypothetical protein